MGCCEVVYQHPLAVLDALLQTIDALAVNVGAEVLVAYQQGRDGADRADAPFWEGLVQRGLLLYSSESLGSWDDVWDDTDARWIYCYRRCSPRPSAQSRF